MISFRSQSLIQAVTANSPAAWYRYGIGLTDAGAGACSAWADQSGNGRDLTAAGSARPTIQADKSLLFDGVANVLTNAGYTLNQPCSAYLLFRQVTSTSGDRIISGIAATAVIQQTAVSARLQLFCTAGAPNNDNLALNTYGAVCAVFNGASSLIQVNNTSATTGDPGSNNPGGFSLGASTAGSSASNIQVKEAIVFAGAHSADTRTRIIRYLSSVGGL